MATQKKKKKKVYLTISPPLTSMHVKLGVNLGIFIGSIIVIINLEYGWCDISH